MKEVTIEAVKEEKIESCFGCVMNPDNISRSPNGFKCDDFKENNNFGRHYSCSQHKTIFKIKEK